MTVRELIEHLETLDQEKEIWICYDMCCYFPPVPDEMADRNMADGMVHHGDYIINAG